MRKRHASRFAALPAWALSFFVHVALLCACVFVVTTQRVAAPDPPRVYEVRIAPPRYVPPPLHPAKQERPPVGSDEGPVVQGGPEAPLFLDAPIGDHNETDNDSDAGTVCLTDAMGVGGGGGPRGAGGRRYLRTAAGRRGATTTRMVDTGLDWLARHQSKEGDWGRYADRCEKGDPSCASIEGNGGRRTAVTALALLAILANGETPAKGPRAETLRRGLAFLASRQSSAGQFESSYSSDDYYSLYEQAIAAWAMTEAFASTGEAKWRDCAARAVVNLDRRYTLRIDTSVMGFVVMALKSAERAGVPVPARAREWGPKYFQLLAERNGCFAYKLSGLEEKDPLSDIGIYASLLYGLPQSSKAVQKCVDHALSQAPRAVDASQMNLYHVYYWTLAYLLAGGDARERWNASVKEVLSTSQVRSGCARGSWGPEDERVSNRVLSTSLAILALHVCDRRLLLHREDSASAADERVGRESMEYGELLHDEALRACADASGEGITAVQAFLDWTRSAEAKSEDDRRAIAEWSEEAMEAAADVAVRRGDLEGALARLSACPRLSPSGRVLRGLVRVKRLPSRAGEREAEAERREAARDLASGLSESPSGDPSLYRLLAFLVKDLPSAPSSDAPEGSRVRFALEQGDLARDTREALKSKTVPPSLGPRLEAARKALSEARARDAAAAALFAGWEKDTRLSHARLALVEGRAAVAEEEALALGRDLRVYARDGDVVELLGAAALQEATRLWNSGRQAEARPHAAVGAAAYALVCSRDAAQARQLLLPTADLFFIAGEYEEAAKRYRTALGRQPDSSSIQERLRAAQAHLRR